MSNLLKIALIGLAALAATAAASAQPNDSGWTPLAFSDDPEAAMWKEHGNISDYYVGDTRIRSSTASVEAFPTPGIVVHTELSVSELGCTALYVKDADYGMDGPVDRKFIGEIEKRRQIMERVHLAKARGLPIRLVISTAEADLLTESQILRRMDIDEMGTREWCLIVRASVQ